LVGAGTFSYFSDTETSTGNTFAAGTLDIKITGEGAALFAYDNIAPGDNFEKTIKIENVGTLSGYMTMSISLDADVQSLSKYIEVIWFGKDTKVAGGPWWYTTVAVPWCDYPSPAIDRAFTGEDNMTQAIKTSSWTSSYAPWYSKLDEFPGYISLYDLSKILPYLGSTAPGPGEYHQVYMKLQLRPDTPNPLQGSSLTWSMIFKINQ